MVIVFVVTIKYNPNSPFCKDCLNTWQQFENYNYLENVCHRCGESEQTTMAKPQCYECFNEWRIE